jgi:hypothetical protein
MQDTAHQLKITLRSVRPPVWRQILVHSDTDLAELALILEAAMGWLGGHLHAFESPEARYAMPDAEWPDDDLDEREFRVHDVLPEVGAKLRWDYDFGDGWEHDVVVEKIVPAVSDVDHPICLAGSMACPPEDCGGPMGYEDLLDALADPTHPEHDAMREWAPPGFDPTSFDVDETTAAMRSARPLEEW